MRRYTVVAAVAGLAVFFLAALVAGVVLLYLTEYGSKRIGIAAIILLFGAIVAFFVGNRTYKFCHGRKGVGVAVTVLAVVLLAPFVSMRYPGKIIYSRFGASVYGIIPVIALDITVDADGVLWFRDKSHHVTMDEVERLLTADVEVLVIGTGWNRAASVDPLIRDIEGVEVKILSTPEAFEFYNRCVSEERKVVLLAHSTC